MRKETRRKFHSRQQTRRHLESRADSRRKQFSNVEISTDEIQMIKTHSQIYGVNSFLTNPTTNKQNFSITQKSYDLGLQ